MKMSVHVAEVVWDWANWLLVGALVVGVVATYFIVQTAKVKEAALKQELAAAGKIAATANERAKILEVRAGELRNTNLTLEKQLVDLKKSVRGREISDEQHDKIIAALRGKKLPNFTMYVVHDFEARIYAFSIMGVLEELGMRTPYVSLDGVEPSQTGVVACGDGTEASREFIDALAAAGVVGVTNPNSKVVIPYCPPLSIFVGRRDPPQTWRVPAVKKQ